VVDPKKPPAGCKIIFSSQGDLDNQKDVWATKIARMPIVETINWIIGGPEMLSGEARGEIVAQRACMINAMRASLKGHKLALPAGDIVKSDVRPYGEQKEDIWLKKFNFTFETKFGHISDSARTKCDKLIGAEVEWDPKSKDHKNCWENQLDSLEKAKEILMTSAGQASRVTMLERTSISARPTKISNRRPGLALDVLQMPIVGSPKMAQPMALFNRLIRRGVMAKDT
jgi:hypothetical protein